MPDPIFADPRLAVLYDFVDDDRSDLDAYAPIVEELSESGSAPRHAARQLADAADLYPSKSVSGWADAKRSHRQPWNANALRVTVPTAVFAAEVTATEEENR